jgi:hypothetical protein
MLRALKGAKNLRDSDTYKEVYVSRDLTRTERLIQNQLRDERNKKNNEDLKETGAGKYPRGSYQGKLFHWGIRDGEVRRIFDTSIFRTRINFTFHIFRFYNNARKCPRFVF